MKPSVSIESPYLERIRCLDVFQDFSIIVNGHTIKLPFPTAIALSEVIKLQYLSDRTVDKLCINVELINQEKSIPIFEKLLKGVPVQLNTDLRDLLTLGKSIGNPDISSLAFREFESAISLQNVLDLVSMKLEASVQPTLEIPFIARNFSIIDNIQKWFLTHATENMPVLELILRSSELVVESEDWLIDFIIKLCKENPKCDSLLGCVFLEYASEDGCSRYIDFVNSRMMDLSCLYSIWVASNNRLKMKLANKPPKIDRHLKSSSRDFKAYNPDNPRYGILFDLLHSQAVNVSASSVSSGSPDDLISASEEAHFFTQNVPRSWVLFTFPKNTIVPQSYMIRGSLYSDDDNQLQSWKLEGLNLDGEWKILDEQKEKPFHQLEVRVFQIENPFEIVSLKLTNMDSSVEGGNRLCISQFELFGNLYDNFNSDV